MASFSFLIFLLMGFHNVLANSDDGSSTMVNMEKEELLGLFEVMGSLLEDPTWAQMHPQPCTNTPWPGVQCEIMAQEDDDQQDYYSSLFHVTKIHIGPDILTPSCKTTAILSPRSLIKLPYLKTLSLFNCFTASPYSLSPSLFQNSSLSSLEQLSLVSNPSLYGKIPPALADIQSLRVISLSQNNLVGEIPKEIGGLLNLKQLDLSYNNITGSVPEEIGGLKSLAILDLSHNKLQGQLPSSFGQLLLLQKIDLGFNELTQRVPQEFGKLNKLVLLDLSHNSLSGPLTDSLAGLKELEYLIIDDNPLNTAIPLFIGSLTQLKVVSFSSCGMIGPIPTYLGSLKNLSALSLDNNSLNGSVPQNLGPLPNLEQLNLSKNQLSGELLVSEEFIRRIGKRLDISRNSGFCIKNITSDGLKSPSCLGTTNKSSWGEEEHPDECEKMKPNWYATNKCSRNYHAYDLGQMFVLLVVLFF